MPSRWPFEEYYLCDPQPDLCGGKRRCWREDEGSNRPKLPKVKIRSLECRAQRYTSSRCWITICFGVKRLA